MSMKVTRFDAALTYTLAALGLWISYTALADLASRAGLGQWQAAAWPLVVDGLILAATRAVVTFGAHDARRYAWTLLGCAAAASIAANAAHALLPSGPVHPAIAAVVAVVPPIAALAMTHLAVVRARVRQDAERVASDNASPQVEAASPPDGYLHRLCTWFQRIISRGEQLVLADAAVGAPAVSSTASLASDDAPADAADAPANETVDAPGAQPCVDARQLALDLLAAPADAADMQPSVDARQRVLELLDTTNMSNRGIAAEVGISESTVRRWKDARDAAVA